jgi:hypothetical protein
MRTRAGRLVLGFVAVLAAEAPSQAYFLDNRRNFDLRLRAYTQLGIMASGGEADANPHDFGDLAQHRNFYNPEFDAKLNDLTEWMAPLRDDLRFRFAWWGFYDGLYDYLNPVWNRQRQNLKARLSEATNPLTSSRFFTDHNKNPRHIYAQQSRVNELYLDYTKGRVFARLGRQAISWGESDTIALQDVSNPFDLTLGAPGFFQDVDEARIPLWTFRTTIKLVDNWRWLSGAFLDAYLVPGPVDTTVSINPMPGGLSPFGPPDKDPQLQIPADQQAALHAVVVDRLPEGNWGNSRWGVRLVGVLFRDYTVQGWFYRTFNQAPSPLLLSPGAIELGLPPDQGGTGYPATLIDDRGFRTPVCLGLSASGTGFGVTPAGRPCSLSRATVTSLERRLESVIGLAGTWYSPTLRGIVRLQGQLFLDELAFIPDKNLNAQSQVPAALVRSDGRTPVRTSMPLANYFRFVIGYDRFFFLRTLNPTNSFVLSMAFNGSFNMSEQNDRNYRYPNVKPDRSPTAIRAIPGSTTICTPQNVRDPNFLAGPLAPFCTVVVPENFEDAHYFEGFLQTAIQTDYMHGRLSPRMVLITDISGIFGFAPTITYRVNDSLLLTGTYLGIAASRRALLGTFRDNDMFQFRITYQLN